MPALRECEEMHSDSHICDKVSVRVRVGGVWRYMYAGDAGMFRFLRRLVSLSGRDRDESHQEKKNARNRRTRNRTERKRGAKIKMFMWQEWRTCFSAWTGLSVAAA